MMTDDNNEVVIDITETYKVHLDDLESPGEYRYGYIRLSDDEFREFYESDTDNLCNFCGRVLSEDNDICECNGKMCIKTEEEVIDFIMETYDSDNVTMFINDEEIIE